MDVALINAIIGELEEYANWLNFLVVKGDKKYTFKNTRRLQELNEILHEIKKYTKVA